MFSVFQVINTCAPMGRCCLDQLGQLGGLSRVETREALGGLFDPRLGEPIGASGPWGVLALGSWEAFESWTPGLGPLARYLALALGSSWEPLEGSRERVGILERSWAQSPRLWAPRLGLGLLGRSAKLLEGFWKRLHMALLTLSRALYIA